MNKLKNIRFDEYCGHITFSIGLMAVILVLCAFVDRGTQTVTVRIISAAAADLSACGMITLFFGMIKYALREAEIVSGKTDCALDSTALVMKLMFIAAAVLSSYGKLFLLHIASLAVDVILSRFYYLYLDNRKHGRRAAETPALTDKAR